MINVVGLDNLNFYYDIRGLTPDVQLVDLFDNNSPCNVKIVPSLPPYAGLGCAEPTENDILHMTLNSMNWETPIIYVNAERKAPLLGGENPANYLTNMRFKYIERTCLYGNLCKIEKYPVPINGFAVKLHTFKKIDKNAVPLITTIDLNHQTWVHAYQVANRYYFLFNPMDTNHRPDSLLYQNFGFPIGDILFNTLLKKLDPTPITPANVKTYFFQ
jgi:hypothetical protein